MKELYKQGLTQKQETFFKKVLGDMTFSISSKNWDSTFNAESNSETYKILSESNGCYHVRFGSDENKKACMVNGNLHIPSSIASFSYDEVFSLL